MAERVREAVERRRLDDGDLAPHLVEELLHARAALGRVLLVQPEVEQRELELAHHREAREERARALQRLDLVARQRRARLVVPADVGEHLGPPREVLEELARQLDGVPGDAVGARERRIVDFRQQVMQRVAELVEQRDDLAVRQQRRPARRPAR